MHQTHMIHASKRTLWCSVVLIRPGVDVPVSRSFISKVFGASSLQTFTKNFTISNYTLVSYIFQSVFIKSARHPLSRVTYICTHFHGQVGKSPCKTLVSTRQGDTEQTNRNLGG
ncbi:hypothetical protein LZ32DRAFT_100552 [Colletotrichum eremochloae]|nr:hypothetical protein LZ32DRAFT_100552 [Colletotrichum eremochloae]